MQDAPTHIAISGDLGSGKSSVAEQVAARLNVSLVSTGAIQRQIASELQLSTLETNLLAEKDREIDRRVDGVAQQLGEESKEVIVFDSRMAWYMVSNSFKVRLIVDPEVAVDRIMDRGPSAVESYEHRDHAQSQVRQRYESEVRRFLARYGVDVTALKHFDLAIDTSDLSVETVSDMIVSHYQQRTEPRVYASPRRVIPGIPVDGSSLGRGLLVVYARPFMIAVGRYEVLESALSDWKEQVEVQVAAEGLEEVVSGLTAAEYLVRGVQESDLTAQESKFGLNYDAYRTWISQPSA